MSNGTGELSYNPRWRDTSRYFCTIKYSRKEIGVWIGLWLMTIIVAWVLYELAIVQGAFWGGGVLAFVFGTIFVLIGFLAVIVGLSLVHDYVWTLLKRRLIACWQACGRRTENLDEDDDDDDD